MSLLISIVTIIWYMLIPFVLAAANRFRGMGKSPQEGGFFPPESTTLKRLVWWAAPFTLIVCSLNILHIYTYEPLLVFLAAWASYALFGRVGRMENWVDMTADGLWRGIILCAPFIWLNNLPVALGVLIGFSLQGSCYMLGKHLGKYSTSPYLDEFAEVGEVLTGFTIGLGLIVGIMI